MQNNMSFSGSSLYPPSTETQTDNSLDMAIQCLRDGRNAQGFALLSLMEDSENLAAVFGLALCYLRAGEVSAAIARLEKALKLTRAPSVAPSGRAENSGTYLTLYRAQLEEKAYLSPMDPDFCAHFPKEAERTVLLALIHAYKLAGLDDKAWRLAEGLTGPAFDVYKKQLLN